MCKCFNGNKNNFIVKKKKMECSSQRGEVFTFVAELSAHDVGGAVVPPVVTHCTPRVVQHDLHAPRSAGGAVRQTHVELVPS